MDPKMTGYYLNKACTGGQVLNEALFSAYEAALKDNNKMCMLVINDLLNEAFELKKKVTLVAQFALFDEQGRVGAPYDVTYEKMVRMYNECEITENIDEDDELTF